MDSTMSDTRGPAVSDKPKNAGPIEMALWRLEHAAHWAHHEGQAMTATCDTDAIAEAREELARLQVAAERCAKLEVEMHAIRYALLFFTPDDDVDISTIGLAEAAKATVAGDYELIVEVQP